MTIDPIPFIPTVSSWTSDDLARMLADVERLRREQFDRYCEACCPPGATMKTVKLITNPTSHPMLRCGHAANSTSNGKPSCVICAPKPEAYEVVDTPDLSKREARCAYCKTILASNMNLAFFEHRPSKPYDDFYCGCRGWD